MFQPIQSIIFKDNILITLNSLEYSKLFHSELYNKDIEIWIDINIFLKEWNNNINKYINESLDKLRIDFQIIQWQKKEKI